MVISRKSWHFQLASRYASDNLKQEIRARTLGKYQYLAVVTYHCILLLACAVALATIIVQVGTDILPLIVAATWSIKMLLLTVLFGLTISMLTIAWYYVEKATEARQQIRMENYSGVARRQPVTKKTPMELFLLRVCASRNDRRVSIED